MREVICVDMVYRINTAFGVLNELEKNLFDMMDDEVIKKMTASSTMKDLEDSPISSILGDDPDSLRRFLAANVDESYRIIAAVLREAVNSKSGETVVLNTAEERMDFVKNELEYEDGKAILDLVQDKLQSGKQGAGGNRRGKSVPSSEKAVKAV